MPDPQYDTIKTVEEIIEEAERSPTKTFRPEEKALIRKAYKFSQQAHGDQKRASGAPFFSHVTMTAFYTASFGMGDKTIAAALLHDIIEDTKATKEEIDEEFGPEITSLIEGVTKLGHLKYRGSDRHVESLRKFFLASAKDPRVIIIKLADRLHNIRTLQYLPPEKQHRIALETIEVHANLAWRLGMGRLTGELQDEAFPYAYPKEYAMVEKLLKTRRKVDEKYLEKVYKSLKKELALHGIKDITTYQRIKKKYSLWQKLKRKEMDVDKIYDLVALRVIVPTVEDCYKVLGIVHNMWRPLPGRIKDYIALPKPNGYQSIHTTIFTGDGGIAEIQIRTMFMHHTAEYGIASHYAYKNQEGLNDKYFHWVQQLKTLEDVDPKEMLKSLKGDFTHNRIFVFTPEGDVIDLPSNSSVIDFAYAVHSDIGERAYGATINGKHSALKTILQNGDIVKIDTKKTSKPTSKWLDYAKTSLARRKIQKYLRDNSSDSIFSSFWKKN